MKQKTKKAAAKRFRFTATGKVKIKRSHLRHILTKKSAGSKLKKRGAAYLTSKGDVQHVEECLPYGR